MGLPTLPTRKTILDIALYTVNTTALLGNIKTHDHNFDITSEEGKAINARYDNPSMTKREIKFSTSIYRNRSDGRRATNLDLSAYTRGGTSHIGDLKNSTLTVTTKTQEGSGVSSLDKYPVSVGTSVEIQVDEFISDTIDLILTGSQDATITDFEMTIALTFAGYAVSVPALMTAGSFKVSQDSLQMQNVTFKLKGTPTITLPEGITFDLLAIIMTGTSAVSYSVDYGTGTQIGYALITKATITINDGQIQEEQYEFEGQGLAAAS